MVRAKFIVTLKTQTVEGWKIELQAVTKTNPENETFFKYTPMGKLEMAIVKGETAELFEVGEEYYLDFTSAVSPAENPF